MRLRVFNIGVSKAAEGRRKESSSSSIRVSKLGGAAIPIIEASFDVSDLIGLYLLSGVYWGKRGGLV